MQVPVDLQSISIPVHWDFNSVVDTLYSTIFQV